MARDKRVTISSERLILDVLKVYVLCIDRKIFVAVKLLIFPFFLSFFLLGCMSLQYRCGENFDIEPGPYPGLRIAGNLIEQSKYDRESAGMIYGMRFY